MQNLKPNTNLSRFTLVAVIIIAFIGLGCILMGFLTLYVGEYTKTLLLFAIGISDLIISYFEYSK